MDCTEQDVHGVSVLAGLIAALWTQQADGAVV